MNVPCFNCLLIVSLFIAALARSAIAADGVLVDSAILQLIEQVDVPARASGVLSAVVVKEGDVVDRGARLAQIDDAEATLFYRRALVELEFSAEKAGNDIAIRSAQKALDFARSENARLKRAAAELSGSVSQSELEETALKADQAELDLEQARHESRLNKLTEKLKRQELDLGKHQLAVKKIGAPVPGVVVEVVRHTGEWVEPGDKVVRIVRIDRLRADGLMHVRHVTASLKGAAATVVVAVPGQSQMRCAGEVVFVSPEVNPVNALVRVSVEFDNPDNRLRPGLRAQITIP